MQNATPQILLLDLPQSNKPRRPRVESKAIHVPETCSIPSLLLRKARNTREPYSQDGRRNSATGLPHRLKRSRTHKRTNAIVVISARRRLQ